MEKQWSLDSHGDPLGRVREFIKQIWREAKMDGMLVTLDGNHHSGYIPRYTEDITQIDKLNPFKPLMEVNAARLVPSMLSEHPEAHIGAVLRPCEMRALVQMDKNTDLKIDHLLTISVDCLGTLPADEYQWRLERKQKSTSKVEINASAPNDDLAVEALKFAHQGGIIPYRYRSACQVCSSPAAQLADINIHVLGLPVRQKMLISVEDPEIAETVHIDKLADSIADPSLIGLHERILSRMSERHERSMERIFEALGDMLPRDVDAFIRQLEACGACKKCMEVCPICSVTPPSRGADGHYDRDSVIRWLASCAGCGMCEQSCPNHLPISSIFAHLREQLTQI